MNKKDDNRQLLLRSDGGSRGNPGPAGFGAVVFTSDGSEILMQKVGYIGLATNNIAEYRGVIAGLEAARELGATEVSVELDSRLIVEQLNGKWKVKNANIKPLAQVARTLIQKFDKVTFSWIPRERNSIADKLANDAMDDPQRYTCGDLIMHDNGSDDASDDSVIIDDSILENEGESDQNNCAAQEKKHPIEHSAIDSVGPFSVYNYVNGWGPLSSHATRCIFIRHGQTPLSVDKRFVGITDQELTEYGHIQAKSLAEYLISVAAPVALYASPLKRTQQTAKYIANALDLQIITDSQFIETDFGEWEGFTAQEAAENNRQIYQEWQHNPKITPPGGESIMHTYQRVTHRIEQLRQKHKGQAIVIVSHVGPIKAAVGYTLGIGPQIAFGMYLELASITVLDMKSNDRGYIRSINETAFLRSK